VDIRGGDEEMRPVDLHATGQLRVVLEAARAFGLSEDDIWEAVITVSCREFPAVDDDPLDELTAVLAQRILDQERRALRSRRVA
jgi:hypothetical protein